MSLHLLTKSCFSATTHGFPSACLLLPPEEANTKDEKIKKYARCFNASVCEVNRVAAFRFGKIAMSVIKGDVSDLVSDKFKLHLLCEAQFQVGAVAVV